MQQELTQILAFTREQAFVIQFHRDANLQGRFGHFHAAHELEAFFKQVLNQGFTFIL
jgi:hypothetical protein